MNGLYEHSIVGFGILKFLVLTKIHPANQWTGFYMIVAPVMKELN